jgi:preprotein translocase subunit YajC
MGSFTAVVAATSTKSGSSSYTFLLLIVLVFVGFYFLMIRPQRRRQQMAQQQQRTLTPGARVRTTAGMYATVSAVDGDDVILEVAPGVDVRYVRRAVTEIISPGEAEETEPVDDAEHEDTEHEDVDGYPDDVEAHDHVEVHDGTGSAEEGLADSHDGKLTKSDKDNVF